MKGKGEELLQRVGKAALRETEEKGDSQWVVRDPQTGAESVGSREGGRGAGWTCCPSPVVGWRVEERVGRVEADAAVRSVSVKGKFCDFYL